MPCQFRINCAYYENPNSMWILFSLRCEFYESCHIFVFTKILDITWYHHNGICGWDTNNDSLKRESDLFLQKKKTAKLIRQNWKDDTHILKNLWNRPKVINIFFRIFADISSTQLTKIVPAFENFRQISKSLHLKNSCSTPEKLSESIRVKSPPWLIYDNQFCEERHTSDTQSL